jgi:hypothetical protein
LYSGFPAKTRLDPVIPGQDPAISGQDPVIPAKTRLYPVMTHIRLQMIPHINKV